VVEHEKLYLLPVQDSDAQWYRNVLKNPSIRIDARGAEAEFRAIPITEASAVKSVVDRFREKYGAGDVKKYYSIFDVVPIYPLGRVTYYPFEWFGVSTRSLCKSQSFDN
jgi:hypothetical protein